MRPNAVPISTLKKKLDYETKNEAFLGDHTYQRVAGMINESNRISHKRLTHFFQNLQAFLTTQVNFSFKLTQH